MSKAERIEQANNRHHVVSTTGLWLTKQEVCKCGYSGDPRAVQQHIATAIRCYRDMCRCGRY